MLLRVYVLPVLFDLRQSSPHEDIQNRHLEYRQGGYGNCDERMGDQHRISDPR